MASTILGLGGLLARRNYCPKAMLWRVALPVADDLHVAYGL